MNLVEELFSKVAADVLDTDKFSFEGHEVSLKPPYKRITFSEASLEYLNVDITSMDEQALKALAKDKGLTSGKIGSRGALLDLLSSEFIEPNLIQPTFLIDYPVELSPLAKLHRSKEGLTERFEIFIGGVEFGNGFSELNDPDDQRKRFLSQADAKKLGDEEAHPIDEDFILALEHGMPPTTGYGLGIDRFAMLLTGNTSIRDVILFPTMKPEVSGSDPLEEGSDTE
jgi:lysyl-tRNA synthetase class 2